MHALSAPELLAAWERGLEQRLPERALALLEAACPESPPQSLAGLSIGRRDAALLTLRQWAFGRRLTCLAVCPACNERLEMTLDAASLQQPYDSAAPADFTLALAGYQVRFRLPNSADLLSCTGEDVAEIQRQLFARCLTEARSQDQAVTADQLPDAMIHAVIEQMAKLDPQADTVINFSCPVCQNRWQENFDIVSFFWSEIDAWARRILHEVHVLASAYGWREREILMLSPLRRQLYIEMANA